MEPEPEAEAEAEAGPRRSVVKKGVAGVSTPTRRSILLVYPSVIGSISDWIRFRSVPSRRTRKKTKTKKKKRDETHTGGNKAYGTRTHIHEHV